MMWISGFVGLIAGIITGLVVIHFTTRGVKKTRNESYDLQKSQSALRDHQEELCDYLRKSMKLLENLERDYQNLYRHIDQGANVLRDRLVGESKIFNDSNRDIEREQDQISIHLPRDYPIHTSSILHRRERC
ncbi:Inner membrane protein YhcB [Candidatus Erwinia haradaeae]|uniref:Z-ring associated protein G n=1 Tax=Candidatus Erwinia haradaeae TaxID=1922217 RepID=A0A451DCC2_9GAMM|nr:Inner membrane protein YhcB [Candidatus Erwinia haradaeae]